MASTAKLTPPGVVVAVRGSVVDLRFDQHLPPVYSLLRAGTEGRIVIEVLTHRDAQHVRGIALTPTQGLARGTPVEDTGGPLKAPVGKGILSRMFDVFGNVIDRRAMAFRASRPDKNIDELLEQLRGTFQRVRQNSIDEELFDVIAGFEELSK